MHGRVLLAAVLFITCAAHAQDIAKGNWERGLFAAASSGAKPGDAPGTAVAEVGFRAGRVMSHERGSGWYRGHYEWAIDVMPVYVFHKDGTTRYGAGLSPLISKWNFTARRSVVPYVELASGVIFTSGDLPGGTNPINFSTGLGFGAQWFHPDSRSVSLSVRYSHISNGGLDRRNPAINTVRFSLGWQWWGRRQ